MHFVGHSYGGTTILTLYQMLCRDKFKVCFLLFYFSVYFNDELLLHRSKLSAFAEQDPLPGGQRLFLGSERNRHQQPIEWGNTSLRAGSRASHVGRANGLFCTLFRLKPRNVLEVHGQQQFSPRPVRFPATSMGGPHGTVDNLGNGPSLAK